jgi:hypothetical protein
VPFSTSKEHLSARTAERGLPRRGLRVAGAAGRRHHAGGPRAAGGQGGPEGPRGQAQGSRAAAEGQRADGREDAAAADGAPPASS